MSACCLSCLGEETVWLQRDCWRENPRAKVKPTTARRRRTRGSGRAFINTAFWCEASSSCSSVDLIERSRRCESWNEANPFKCRSRRVKEIGGLLWSRLNDCQPEMWSQRTYGIYLRLDPTFFSVLR